MSHTTIWRQSLSTMVEEKGCKDSNDLTCIHWGYLNVLHLNDVSGKRIKHPSWKTFWTDLCGATLRLYKDISLPEDNSAFPPATVIGPRPESQVKYAFFSLKNGTLKDFDAVENSPRLSRRNKLARKHVLQIILSNLSVYCVQAPTMSAFYRWKTKLQSSIDNADGPEKLYDKQLRDAKLALYQQRRCYFKPEPTYPDVVDLDTEDEEKVSSVSPPQDPRLIALKQKLMEKRHLLNQLEKQEKDFLGTDKDDQCIITRIEFSATARKNYFLVTGRRDTLIPEASTFTIFGRLPNGRWRCYIDREDRRRSSEGNTGQRDVECNSYPLIGSVPTSVVVELNQPSRIKDFVDSLSVSSGELTPSGTPAEDISPKSFTYDVIPSPSPQSPRRSSEPYSNHKSANANLRLTKSAPLPTDKTPPPSRPTKLTPLGRPDRTLRTRATRPSDSSISPTSPGTPTQIVSNAISDLNRALQSLAALNSRPKVTSAVSTCSAASTANQEAAAASTANQEAAAASTANQEAAAASTANQEAAAANRSRVSSTVSTCSRASSSSQEGESSDMSRGSRIELLSDDESTTQPRSDSSVRRRKRRDIHISRKLHAKGISLIVGSSSSSEDEEDEEPERDLGTSDKPMDTLNAAQSRKIEGLHSSKEKLTEKVSKGLKSSPENTVIRTNEDRPSVDKPTTTTDVLREFSENGCYGSSYGLPIRNSVTQAQFKPLASHEIPPPLHQRRTLQMTRRDNEGFGFVLQTNTIIQPGAYSDSMTFVSNVSEDGPAYLAGMRPGDVIIEVENGTVEDDDHHMIANSLETAGLTIRLVVVYKDAIRRMRLSTRLLALKARLNDAENAYDALSKKEKMLLDHVKDPSVRDIKVRMAVIHIHIQIASTTFARDTPEIKNSVVQTKRTPTELLELKQSSEMAKNCGVPTTGYELVREFSTICESKDELEPQRKTTSPKYASDTALDVTKKRKFGESISKYKTLKQCQRSSFVSYIDLDINDSASSRRRVKSDSYDPDDESKLSNDFVQIDKVPPMAHTLPVQSRVTRPESYMFAVGSQNALDKSYFKDLPQPKIAESTLEDGFV